MALTWPRVASAQVVAKRPLVAVLSGASSTAAAPYVSALPRGLQELGYIEGRDIDIVYRYASGDLARVPALTDELVRLKPDVFVVFTISGIRAIQKATTTIPIVDPTLVYPEAFGFVRSIARPGGQVTGILWDWEGLVAKRLQLVLEVLPGATRIGVLENVSSAPADDEIYWQSFKSAVDAMGSTFVPIKIRVPDDLDTAFQAFVRERVELVFVLGDPTFVSSRRRIAELAIAARLPTMSTFREFAADGCLMSYGDVGNENMRRAASFVDKILKGAKPGDLPVEMPTKFELVINLKTAKALGLTIPQPLLLRANEVIE